jgi:hypothetical protein
MCLLQLHHISFRIVAAAYAMPLRPSQWIRLGKAVFYTLGQWSKLAVFLTHGDVPMHNNRCENAIRPFATERSLCTS